MSAAGVSLDTSVLLRLLVAQPLDQFRVAIGFLQAQRANHVSVHVGDLVLAEGYFALLSFYRFSKPDALAALSQFVEHSGVTVSPAARDSLALPGLATAQPGFVDRLIHGTAHSSGHTLVSFEKAAKKLPSTLVLATAG
jgi:predicted nucleic-acid-binding protein